MEITDPRVLLTRIAKVLNDLSIPYLVTGGMAVFIWGRPRYTADIDIVIELSESQIQSLVEELRKLGDKGYIDPESIRTAVRTPGEFNFIEGETGVKVDFWEMKQSDFDRKRMERRIPLTILGEKIFFISPEDLILAKTQWHIRSASSRQIEDIESIFAISGETLDQAYLKEWALKLGCWNVLEKFVLWP